MKNHETDCQVEGCNYDATVRINGVSCCDRCGHDYTSVGVGAVYFSGRWHGVRGARYTEEQIAACPGIEVAS